MIRTILILCGLVLICGNVYAAVYDPPTEVNVVPDMHGYVRYDNGTPIPNVMINIYKRSYDGADTLITTVTTDENGRYNIAGDFKGTYVIAPNDKRFSFSPLNGAVVIKGTTTTNIK